MIFTFSVSIVVGALVAATLTSLVHNTGVTRLGSLSKVDLIQSILADYIPVAAHSSTITPAALLASSTTTSSTRKERLLIIIEDILVVAGNTVQFTDGRLAASILSKSFIACLVLAVIDPGANHWPSSDSHKEETYYHIADSHDIVNVIVIAAQA